MTDLGPESCPADRKLPAVEALIDRAERLRAWLDAARGCDCASIDDCGLFDREVLPSRHMGVGVTSRPEMISRHFES